MPLSPTKSPQTDRVNQFFKLYHESLNNKIEKSKISDPSNPFRTLFETLSKYDAKSFTIFKDDTEYDNISMDDFSESKSITQLIDCEIIYFNGSFRTTSSYTFIFLKSQLNQIRPLIVKASNQLPLFCIYSELTNRNQLSVEPMSFTSTLFNASIAIDNTTDDDYYTANKLMYELNKPCLINEIANSSNDTFDSFIDLPLLEKFSHQTAITLAKEQNDINIQHIVLLLSKIIYRISHSINFTTK